MNNKQKAFVIGLIYFIAMIVEQAMLPPPKFGILFKLLMGVFSIVVIYCGTWAGIQAYKQLGEM